MNKILTAAQKAAIKKGIISEAQLTAILEGKINAATDKQKEEIQEFLAEYPENIAKGTREAIDNGEELELHMTPLGTTITSSLKERLAAEWTFFQDKEQWVGRFVAPRANSASYRKAERNLRTLLESIKEHEGELPEDEGEYEPLIYNRRFSRHDPTGDEATFNVDRERFIESLPEYLRPTYELREMEFKEQEIAKELHVKQSTVSKHIRKIRQMWYKYYRA